MIRLTKAVIATLGAAAILAMPSVANAEHRDYQIQLAVKSHYDPKMARMVAHRLERYLPGNVRIVRNPRRADAVLHLHEKHFRQDIGGLHRHDRSVRYPKRYRRAYHGCDRLLRAHFVKVEGHAYADFRYGVSLSVPGTRRDRYTDVRGRVRDHVEWGRRLRAETPCGFVRTDLFPTPYVERLFAQAPRGRHGGRRHGSMPQLKYAAAERIAAKIAHSGILSHLGRRGPYVTYRGYRYDDDYEYDDDRRRGRGHRRNHDRDD